jgi:hypothetical protein
MGDRLCHESSVEIVGIASVGIWSVVGLIGRAFGVMMLIGRAFGVMLIWARDLGCAYGGGYRDTGCHDCHRMLLRVRSYVPAQACVIRPSWRIGRNLI